VKRDWLAVCLVILVIMFFSLPVLGQGADAPAEQPDAATGLALFAERCANCHGPEGGGNGEMAASLPAPPAAFSDPEFRRTAVPSALFEIITNGILSSGMPPFGPASSNPISQANRWHLVAAIYSLGTPAETIANGQTIYEANCLACHGASGRGDGPGAAESDTPPPNLADLAYWFTRSNEAVFATLESGRIPEHAFDLSEEERWAVVDYGRTFSYAYEQPSAPVEAIEAATVSGQVVNGTTSEVVPEGSVRLRAFTTDLAETLNMTTTVGTDGRYSFNLSSVQSDWVYLASMTYNGISFNSDVNQLSPAQPALELPIVVYEQTTDPSNVAIDQIHMVLEFGQDQVQVSELYVFGNRGTAVFVGESGDTANGTVEIALPAGAENISFQRTFGAMDSFLPADEVIQTETGWADTLPLRPGNGALNLLVTYALPYRSGMTLAHPVAYEAANASIIMLDVGVTVEGEAWVAQGAQQTQGGAFLTYSRRNLAADSALTLALNGQPQPGANASGSSILARDETNELIIGGGVLLLTLAAVAYTVRTWQGRPAEDGAYEAYAGEKGEDGRRAHNLLQAIADLDDAYENGEIGQQHYSRQREQLMSELVTMWPAGGEGA
jgi:mono/diheme cytochrome c family protein